ncbi:PREDICTED: uncharacterized protein LOC102860924 [Elephantulus edwardii]|uniref:uncharacterized protein LOC102860924 n=1 Tax=Elephantulus edwardii TaxID=28737 RepID=UPI0003F0635D|nr:PREDICTED: uncharacterized protein LOC102860924 [Elephantulus edwardii]
MPTKAHVLSVQHLFQDECIAILREGQSGEEASHWARTLGDVGPVPSTVTPGPICCSCRVEPRDHLPIPRADAGLPDWVPLSLRPWTQTGQVCTSGTPRARTPRTCSCPCHRFGGHLPVPRDQAVMPYWVPQCLRAPKMVRERGPPQLPSLHYPQVQLASPCGLLRCPACIVAGSYVPCPAATMLTEPAFVSQAEGEQPSDDDFEGDDLDEDVWYGHWRVCCDPAQLLQWQLLQALWAPEAESRAGPDPSLLPFLSLGLSLLGLLQAIMSVLAAFRVRAVPSMPPSTRQVHWTRANEVPARFSINSTKSYMN